MPGNPQMLTFSQTTLTIRTDGRTDKYRQTIAVTLRLCFAARVNELILYSMGCVFVHADAKGTLIVSWCNIFVLLAIHTYSLVYYCIAGKFGGELNLAVWRSMKPEPGDRNNIRNCNRNRNCNRMWNRSIPLGHHKFVRAPVLLIAESGAVDPGLRTPDSLNAESGPGGASPGLGVTLSATIRKCSPWKPY